jgi:glutamine amidotransferase
MTHVFILFILIMFKTTKDENSLLKTSYGYQFDSGIVSKNIYGVQFHPEKSHKFGMRLFEQFAKL